MAWCELDVRRLGLVSWPRNRVRALRALAAPSCDRITDGARASGDRDVPLRCAGVDTVPRTDAPDRVARREGPIRGASRAARRLCRPAHVSAAAAGHLLGLA